MVPVLSLLSLIKGNWKIILLLVAIVVVFGTGYHYGAAGVQAEWTAEKLEREKAYTAALVAEQAKAAKKSAEYQEQAAKERQKALSLNRRLKDEIAKNTAYAGCVVTDDIMRLYEEARRHH